ncbi:NGF domain-containing protein [Nephila pilipes]|uniref:NGF domain-containing protein n=1 Tax=Nephila pilipes TaxID=299642 RepID=A0A8X6PCS8_NEPPI|nr:NGF domain-containing protein [Nephila pilipes]
MDCSEDEDENVNDDNAEINKPSYDEMINSFETIRRGLQCEENMPVGIFVALLRYDVQSICRPKKSWVQVYGRTSGDTWRPHWVAVDTACVCSIRKKRLMSLSTGRAPLTGKNFLP